MLFSPRSFAASRLMHPINYTIVAPLDDYGRKRGKFGGICQQPSMSLACSSLAEVKPRLQLAYRHIYFWQLLDRIHCADTVIINYRLIVYCLSSQC